MSALHTLGTTQIPVATLGKMHDHIARLEQSNSELLKALQAVAAKLGSRPYGTGSYLPRALRDQVIAAIANAPGSAS